MANYLTTDTDLGAVANAIRTKGGTSAALAFPAGFVQAIGDIPTGGGVDYLGQLLNKAIVSYENSDVTELKTERTFYQQTNLTDVSFPNVTKLGACGLIFNGCTSLQHIHFPKLEFIDGATSGFAGCTALEIVVLPNHYRTFQGNIFQNCTSLKIYDAGMPTAPTGNFSMFGQNFFNGDSALHTVIIRTENRVGGLGNINTFSGTRFASGGAGGTLYVPAALISSYQSATNWSTILGYANNQILPIEGSAYENAYADGTPIT